MRIPTVNIACEALTSPQVARGLVVVVVCAVLTGPLSGCSALRRQMAERREACSSLCQQARSARSEGWPDQADLLLNEAARQRPDDLETRRLLADAMWDCDRQHDALSEYQELVAQYSKDAGLHQRLAVMSWAMGQKELAAQSAERALQLDPASTDALLIKARYSASRRDYDAAVATYIQLCRAAPDLIEAKVELAEIHIERDCAQQACALLREVVATPTLSPATRADVEWKLGLAYASAERWTEAAQHLAHALENRDAGNSDWQMIVMARSMAGESTDLPSKPVTVAGRQSPEVTPDGWSRLRDRLVARSGFPNSPMASDSVIRADFSKTASRTP